MRSARVQLALVLLLAVSCASRDAILSRTMAGLNAAHAAFVEGDAQRQALIVADATSRDDGTIALAAYRVKRDRVATAFVAAYSAVAVASLDLTDAALLQVVQLASQVVSALRELGIIPPATGGVR